MKKNMIKYIKLFIVIIALFATSCEDITIECPLHPDLNDTISVIDMLDSIIIALPLTSTDAIVNIAKYQGDKKAAVILQFDDSTPGQATLGVPALNSRGIVGTWYVNPGRVEFNDYHIGSWIAAVAGGQELANHTMNHSGASTYEEVVYEVGEASKVIWGLRGEEDFGSLIAFNRGGGTSWNEEDLAAVLAEYKNIDRQSNLGIQVLALSVPAGSTVDQIFPIVPMVVADSLIGHINFHGIAAADVNPPVDYGNAAISITVLENLLDSITAVENEIWVDGYIAVYKYIKERESAAINIVQYDDGHFRVNLTSGMDEKYYNEPLTIVVSIPMNWTSCQVTHDGIEEVYAVNDGVFKINAIPNKGEIRLIEN